MRDARCAMAPMVEAKRDDRLDEREVASLVLHVEGCAACRALERDLDRLADLARRSPLPPATPLEHERGRGALLGAAVLEADRVTPGPIMMGPKAALDAGGPAPRALGPSTGTVRWAAISLAAVLALAFGALPKRGASRPTVARHHPRRASR